MRLKAKIAVAVVLCAAVSVASGKQQIPYERFTLPNGLRVIVHEDHKAPIVAVRVAYHVGAKDEPPGKTGFAHLFEHLMFKGSENFRGDYFRVLDDVGAVDANATTTHDTTQYFQTVPTPALERVLWLESDRMGHFVGTLTPAVLAAELGVVRNEKRDAESGPLGPASGRFMEALFPEGHPYRRSVLGSMADLQAASVEDVSAWFRKYYGATNAVVVLSGDIDVARARALVEKYFGDVPPGEPLHRMHSWVPQLAANVRESVHARVAQPSLEWSWPVAATADKDSTLLAIAAQVLSGTLKDRLYGELVERHKLATSAGAALDPMELAGIFTISVAPKAGADLERIECIVQKQLELFLRQGPTRREMAKITRDLDAWRLLGLQSISGKAQWLVTGELFTRDPAFGERSLEWSKAATMQEVRAAANRWLAKPHYQLTVQRFGEFEARAASFDRSAMPAISEDLELDLPAAQEATLSNGMRIVLVERHEVPAISMMMVFANAGHNSDQVGKPGTAATTFTLMSAGPARLAKAAYMERLQELHAGIGTGTGGRDATASFSVLKKNLSPALELWAQVLRRPAFRQTDFDLWYEDTLLGLESARINPGSIANRALGKALYPADHPLAPLANPESLVKALSIEDLRRFHAEWVRPDIAKLFIVGDTTLQEITRELERVFVDWRPPQHAPRTVPAIAPVEVPDRPRFILIDWPQEQQAQIIAGRFVLPAQSEQSRMLSAANDILGGSITARLGQRLRVEKGWTYGISSATDGGLVQQYWGLAASVQSERAAEAVGEIIDVMSAFTGPAPGTEEELARFVRNNSQALPGMFETADALLGELVRSNAYGRPYDWIEGTGARLRALKLDDVNRVAREYFTPGSLTWILIGDLAKFEAPLRQRFPGQVEVWDREGNRVR
jgi:zinc protease